MRQLKLVLAISAAFLYMSAAQANSLPQTAPTNTAQVAESAAGLWKGAVSLPNKTELVVEINLDNPNQQWRGNISIPQQGAKDLALQDISISDKKAQFTIVGIPGAPTFSGEFDATKSSLKGDFTQGGTKMAFTLSREGKAQASPVDVAKTALVGFENEVEKIRNEWKVPGLAIAIIKGNQIIYAKGHGLRDVVKNLPMTADTILPIGSSTKAFTTAVMASLVDEGKLEWDKPIRSWIPTFKLQDAVATERMTPLDLVTHRSGMPRHDALWYNATLSRADMVRRLQYLEPNKDFRTDFQYNNAMFLTAGYLSEVITGKSWEENVKEKLFMPLGMKRANFSVEETQKDADFSQPYREEKNGTVKQIPYRSISNVGPAGSINSSVNELSAWMQIHLNKGKFQGKQVLSPASIEYLHIPRMVLGGAQSKPELVAIGYAPGWFSDVYRGQLRLHHGGNIDGFAAMVMMLPGSDIGIAVLSNLDGSPVRDFITRAAIDRLMGLEKRDWSGEALKRKNAMKADNDKAEEKKKMAHKTGTKPSHPITDYAGEYEHPGYGIATITQKDGKLTVEFNGIKTPLEHWHYDTFNGLKADDPVFEDQKIQFLTGLDGEIDAVKTALEPAVKDIVFTKKADSRLQNPEFLKNFVGTFNLNKEMDIVMSVRGNSLIANIKGQPTYELLPVRGYRFSLKGLNGFSVEFKADKDGKFNTAELEQPNGIFTVTRK
ncbi:serine hydrolase [Undibacterium sp.]|uniref:serine hydrolase n=1 Tax=Undibacterium sp. TaxID=1914977 RepID=UPI0037518D59